MILSVITGMFKEFFMVFLIVIVHEFGHFIMAKYFRWNFDKIVIYPFGGCTKFDEKVNCSMREEFFILICGPLFQFFLFFIVYILMQYGFVSYRNYLIFSNYHYTLLIFNLLPIYPLDGGKLLNIVVNYFFSYKRGNIFVIFVSIVFIFGVMFLYRSFNFVLMGTLLLFEIFLYFKRQNFLYNKMLLEKYMYCFYFNRFSVVSNKNSMYRNRRHVVLYDGKYITEREYLDKRFR